LVKLRNNNITDFHKVKKKFKKISGKNFPKKKFSEKIFQNFFLYF
jgi:hypothetical protein